MLLNFLLVLVLSIAAVSACGCFDNCFSSRSRKEEAYSEALKFCKSKCASYFRVRGTDYIQAFYPYSCLEECMAERNQTYRRPDHEPKQDQTSCQKETNAKSSTCGCFGGLFSWFEPHPAMKLFEKANKECTKECMESVPSTVIRILTGIPNGFRRNDTCMKDCMERKRLEYIPLKNETKRLE
ncbi:unnamed protein product [Cylicocyclus nassatus]|uniref:Uncharacterized protein n=1 Tax=Cylicocyclus nassatus TaxID=53992 RepID=A0AA36M9J2_CYLNA|nr:unnamed protein product [Cylicocyclus nassatus]